MVMVKSSAFHQATQELLVSAECIDVTQVSFHKRLSFPLKISPVNVTKSADEITEIRNYWRNP